MTSDIHTLLLFFLFRVCSLRVILYVDCMLNTCNSCMRVPSEYRASHCSCERRIVILLVAARIVYVPRSWLAFCCMWLWRGCDFLSLLTIAAYLQLTDAICVQGEKKTLAAFQRDPYGCSDALARKRQERDPFAIGPYTPERCPVVGPLLAYCGPNIYTGPLAW